MQFHILEVAMRKRMQAAHRAVVVSLAGILLVAAQTIHAQNIFGSIVGTVSDATGAVLPKASVTVTNMGTDERETPLQMARATIRFFRYHAANTRSTWTQAASSISRAAPLTWSLTRWPA